MGRSREFDMNDGNMFYKQIILQRGLPFDLKLPGFSAVSIRDICGKVEIKESSVYYHYKNKQAILDAILQLFTDRADQMMG
jgi:antitoxin component of RelBE/YafQ-DinJ toxin-antitoxin module